MIGELVCWFSKRSIIAFIEYEKDELKLVLIKKTMS